MFYPGEARALSAEVDELLGGIEPAPRLGFPKALVVLALVKRLLA